jgi:cell division protein FtsQ
MKKAGLPVIGLDAGDVTLDSGLDDAPFLRPKRRMKARRARRGLLARSVLFLRLFAVLVVTAGAVFLAYAKTMASTRLRVSKLVVRGSGFLSEGEVRELLGPAMGENILTLDIEALKARLRSSPWVADAAVGRSLPDTLKVDIQERVPLALAEVERLYLMDRDGGLIDLYGPRTATFDLPIVRGLSGVDEEARRDRAQRAGALLADLQDLAGEVSEVFVLPSGDVRVVLRGAGEVLLLGEAPHRPRLLTFLSLRKDLTERCPDALYFDLRFRGRIYAKQPPPPAPLPPPRPLPERARPAPAAHPSPAAPAVTTLAAPAPGPASAPEAPAPPPAAISTHSVAAEPPRDDQGR